VTDDDRLAAELATAAGDLLMALRADLGFDDPRALRGEGDRRSHELLVDLLARRRPGDAVLSEEGKDDPARLAAERVWIVDPLDGTREFSELDRADWAVHVALLQDGDLVAGAVLAVLAVAWDERVDSVSDQRAATVALLADETAVALDTEAMLHRLEHRATTDALTGLPNRRVWEQVLPELLDAARRAGTPLTVALADLDRFKAYNDTRGHQAGDDLLRRFADHCTDVLREPDLVARWGGEEFAVVLPACGGEPATGVLERLRTGLPEGQTCSVGYAVWDGVESAEDLLARADAALYTAKSLGRDTLCGAPTPPPPLS
jgi:diguanylate cyclase (GGDEF)-like protein